MTGVVPAHKTKGHSPQAQRGAAAMEFVLVLPAFLLLVSGLMTFSFAFLAKGLLGDVVNSAARACVMRSQSLQAVKACASDAADYLQKLEIGHVCPPGNTSIDITTMPVMSVLPATAPAVNFISIKLTCAWNQLPLLNLTAHAASGPMNMTAIATVPFLGN